MAQLAALLKAQNVDAAAHDAATSDLNLLRKPTEAQAAAGNYKKGHTRVAGLSIAIENPAGSRRRPEWPPMQAHYGYIKRTEGADGDAVDIFVRPSTPEDWDGPVFVVDQTDGAGGFDEHKVLLGYDDEASAVRAYTAHFPDGWEIGAVTEMTLDEFKVWLRDGDTTVPVAKLAKAISVRELQAAFLRKEFVQSSSPTAGITAYGNTDSRKKRKTVRLRASVS
jgi:hypothetical protein